jgi:hypothetical protein
MTTYHSLACGQFLVMFNVDTSTLIVCFLSYEKYVLSLKYFFMYAYEPTTLCSAITMFSRTDIILQNIFTFKLNVTNIPHNIVNMTEHCYGYE